MHCPYVHSQKDIEASYSLGESIWTKGSWEYLVHRTYEHYAHKHYYYAVCYNCKKTSSSLPKAWFEIWQAQGVPIVDEHIPSRINSPPCAYVDCTQRDVEEHHFAPRAVFADANSWPTAWLCRYHHDFWHRSMLGYASYAYGTNK